MRTLPTSCVLAVLVAASCAAALEESGLGCLRWQGSGGCDAIKDRDVCLGSRDGRPWKQWEGYRISGEPCAWCGGGPCVEGGEALCAPRDWAEGVLGAAVANCSAGAAVPLADGDAAEEGDAAGEFESGGDGFRCSAEYAEESLEFNDYFFTFSAPSLGACRAICAGEGYCTGAEFVAEGLVCRAWWHPIGSLEPADGHGCARRPRGAGSGPEAQARVEAEAAEAAAEAEAAKAAAEAARQREQEAIEATAEAAAEAAMQREQGAAEAATGAEEANATEGGLTPGQAAAIGGGVAGGVVGAGLIGGLVGGLLHRTTETVTTTIALLGNATAANNRTLADVPAEGAHSAYPAWWSLTFLGLLCATIAGLLLVRSKAKASTRSVALEHEEESLDACAEAGLAKETPLRWPDWARPPYRGANGAPYRVVSRAAPSEPCEPCESRGPLLLPREPLGNAPAPGATFLRAAEPLRPFAEPVAVPLARP